MGSATSASRAALEVGLPGRVLPQTRHLPKNNCPPGARETTQVACPHSPLPGLALLPVLPTIVSSFATPHVGVPDSSFSYRRGDASCATRVLVRRVMLLPGGVRWRANRAGGLRG